MGVGVGKLRAIVYLHLLRTWRYKYSFINSTINMGLWVAIFILGALLFVPRDHIGMTAPYVFWGIILWSILSSSVWSIGGWTWFVLSLGLYEEHVIHDARFPLFLSGRLVTVVMDTLLITPVMYFLVKGVSGGAVLVGGSPLYIAAGIASMTVMAFSYAFTLSTVSLRIGVPGTLLDLSNFLFLVLGGIAVPVQSLPGPLRRVALLIPFSYPSELTRYGATGLIPSTGVTGCLIITVFLSVGMLSFSLAFYRYVENRFLRVYGPRAIGKM